MRNVTTKGMGIPALLLATAAALALACDGSSHPTAPPPAQPPVSAGLGGVWVGERSVAVVTQGQDTCLGRLLAERAPSQVWVELREQPELSGTLLIDAAGESCTLFGEVPGATVSWYEYKCYPNCWWEVFECDGRRWSFCRDMYGHERVFRGQQTAGQLTGLQRYRFRATAGDPTTEYEVELILRYDLHR